MSGVYIFGGVAGPTLYRVAGPLNYPGRLSPIAIDNAIKKIKELEPLRYVNESNILVPVGVIIAKRLIESYKVLGQKVDKTGDTLYEEYEQQYGDDKEYEQRYGYDKAVIMLAHNLLQVTKQLESVTETVLKNLGDAPLKNNAPLRF